MSIAKSLPGNERPAASYRHHMLDRFKNIENTLFQWKDVALTYTWAEVVVATILKGGVEKPGAVRFVSERENPVARIGRSQQKYNHHW